MSGKAIEAAARAICQAGGENPDAKRCYPSDEPMWVLCVEEARTAVQAYLAAMEAEAVMVPVEPTPQMVAVFDEYHQTLYNPASTYRAAHTWAAMLAARPQPKD